MLHLGMCWSCLNDLCTTVTAFYQRYSICPLLTYQHEYSGTQFSLSQFYKADQNIIAINSASFRILEHNTPEVCFPKLIYLVAHNAAIL